MDFHVSFIMLMDLRLFLNCFSPHSTHIAHSQFIYTRALYIRTSLVTHNASRAHAHSTECDSQSSLSFYFIRSFSRSLILAHYKHTHFIFFPLSSVCYAMLCARFHRIKSKSKQKKAYRVFGNHIVYLTNISERLKNHIFQIVCYTYKNRYSLTNFQQLYKIQNIIIIIISTITKC